MPNIYKGESSLPVDDLEVAAKIMETVSRQVQSYSMSLEKLRLLRREVQSDGRLLKKMSKSPEDMAAVLESRGIPAPLSVAMAAEDFKTTDFGDFGRLGIWTWDCCCTNCCITCIITSINNAPSNRV